MNVNQQVRNALSSIGVPVHANFYAGTLEEYITFNYADERPTVSADDVDIFDLTTIQVHYFTRGNPQDNKKAIRRMLRDAGFSIENTAEVYENDTGYTHVIVYAAIGGEIDD